MANFGPLTDEIDWRVWGTPANFNGFRVLASLLQRRRSREANQTLHDVWQFLSWYTIYTFSVALAPWRNFATCKIHFTSKFCVLNILTALLHSTPAAGVSQTLRRGTRKWNDGSFAQGTAITLGIGPHSSWRYFASCIFQRAACSIFQTCIINSH